MNTFTAYGRADNRMYQIYFAFACHDRSHIAINLNGEIHSNQKPSINMRKQFGETSNCDLYMTIRRENLCFSNTILRKHLDYEIISHFCRRRLVVFVVFIIVAVVSRR